MTEKVTLIPIAMVTPTKEFIYAPSRTRPAIEIDHGIFISEYADNAKSVSISFAADGKSNPVLTTTYSGNNSMKGRFVKR